MARKMLLASVIVGLMVPPAVAASGPKPAEIQAAIVAMKGQPVSIALARMGAPDQDITTAGVHLLAWSEHEDLYGTHCKLNVQLGDDNAMMHLWFSGERAACHIMARRLTGL